MLVHSTPPMIPRVPSVRPPATPVSRHDGHSKISTPLTPPHPIKRPTNPLHIPPLSARPALHGNRTSSLRDPLPDASRSPSAAAHSEPDHDQIQVDVEDDFLAHQTKAVRRAPAVAASATRRRKDDSSAAEHDDDNSANPPRADKRRRVTKGGKAVTGDANPSSSKQNGSSVSPPGSSSGSIGRAPASAPLGPPPPRRGNNNLPSIKPIGFAASRELRREDGGEAGLPSPVVMGFDYKLVDEDQLKTVRDTISIKEQQQALIAARRREANASNPGTPKEMTFKGWAPKDSAGVTASTPTSGGVGRRREKTRDKVEKLSIVTSASDKDVVPGSKSAPLGQGLTSQQASPRDLPSGSQTALPPHLLPPPGGYSHHNGLSDLRTAPLSHDRSRDEHEFARQQAPYYNLSHARRGYEPHQIGGTDRRNFSVPSNSANAARHPLPSHALSGRYEAGARLGGGGGNAPGSPSSPRASGSRADGSGSRDRESFIAPFNQLYDLLAQAESLKFSLQDLLHRYESAYQTQHTAMGEFKSTASAAGTLLTNLQQSADSLKEMVRYEVERNGANEKREVNELRERVRRLEEKLGKDEKA